MKRNKKKRWTKYRHKVIFALLRPFFKIYFKIRYRLEWERAEKTVPKPCIIMSNHQTVMDPFIMAVSFKRPLYFITSDDLFSIKFVSPIIEYLTGIIPKSKSKSDVNTVRTTLKVLKEGGTVGVFPEGNRTLTGECWDFDDSGAKLVKMAKVPLVLFTIEGGYGVDPRWGGGLRKGRMKTKIKRVVLPEEIEKLSVNELDQIIKSTLFEERELKCESYKSKRKAEYLERALYYCPKCGRLNTLESKNSTLYCKECGYKAEYQNDLTFVSEEKDSFKTVKEWFDAQQYNLKLQCQQREGVLFCDKGLTAFSVKGKSKKKLGTVTLKGLKNGIIITDKSQADKEVLFSSLYGCAILGKRKINFYLDDKITLQIKGSKRFNAVKYLHLYEINKADN